MMFFLIVGALVSCLSLAPLPAEKPQAASPQSSGTNASVSLVPQSKDHSPFHVDFSVTVDARGSLPVLIAKGGKTEWNCGMPVVTAPPDVDPRMAKPAPMKGHVRVVPPAACGK
ncbi:MAG: hypothetical protein ACM3NQ_16300 [Bacteroidales bacterium]